MPFRGNSHQALCVCWGLVPYVCVHTQSHTPRHTLVDRQGSHGHSHARDYAHTCPTSRRKDCRHTVLKGAWWPLGSGPRGICPFSSLGLRHGAPTYTVPMATALPAPRPSPLCDWAGRKMWHSDLTPTILDLGHERGLLVTLLHRSLRNAPHLGHLWAHLWGCPLQSSKTPQHFQTGAADGGMGRRPQGQPPLGSCGGAGG